MDLNNEEIWSNFLEIIKKELHPVSFNTWFGETKLYEISNDKIILQVPMPLHKKMLLTNYYSLISDSFAKISGVERNIECILKEEITDKSEQIIDNVLEKNVDKIEVINKKFDSNLNKTLNFDNFVVGDTNKFARTAAFAVAQNPGVQYNPLFIYGKSGLGKTHLMHAIGNYINENNQDLKVLYTTSDDFRKDYTGIANSNDNSLDYANEFKNKYRNIDV